MEVKEIAKRLNITEDQAVQVKGVIKGEIDPLSFSNVKKWVNQCYNMPSKTELKLEALNQILEGYGVEYIEHKEDSFPDVYGISYINLGDTYINTVLFDRASNKWRYCSWGDIVETSEDYI